MFPVVSSTMGDMNGTEWKRLATLIVRRRTELGMRTTKALSDATGLTPRALGDIENGRRDNYTTATKLQIERALEWAPGSIDAILTGGEPSPEHRNEPEQISETGVIHAATMLWNSICDVLTEAEKDNPRSTVTAKARRAVVIASDVLMDLLLAVNAGTAAKPLIEEMVRIGTQAARPPLKIAARTEDYPKE